MDIDAADMKDENISLGLTLSSEPVTSVVYICGSMS